MNAMMQVTETPDRIAIATRSKTAEALLLVLSGATYAEAGADARGRAG